MGAMKGVLAGGAIAMVLGACGPSSSASQGGALPPGSSAAGVPTPPPSLAVATHRVDVPGAFSAVVPVAWKQASFDTQAIAHSTVIVYFSTEAISNPCSRIPAAASAASAGASCPQYPVDRLQPDGVLVTWTAYGLGGQGVDPTQGEAVTVGGTAARLTVGAADASCSAIIGERLMVMRIPGGQPPAYTEMRACYLGPDLDQTEAQLRGFLASVTWH